MYETQALVGLRNGDRHAFEYIYKLMHAKIFLIPLKYSLPSEDAKDVRSHCFIKLWECHATVPFDNFKALYGWLRRIAVRKSIDILRANKCHAGKAEIIEQTIISNLEGNQTYELEDKEAAIIEVLLNKYKCLPPRYKQVFKMRCFDGMKFIEISTELGVRVDTIKKRYARSLQLMRRILVFVLVA